MADRKAVIKNADMAEDMQQDAIDDMDAEADSGVTFLDMTCAGHSCVLPQKQLINSTGAASRLVKMGHTLESGRTRSKYIEGLKQIAKDNFFYKEVAALPEGAAAWRLEGDTLGPTQHIPPESPST